MSVLLINRLKIGQYSKFMKLFSHREIIKFNVSALLVAGIVLFCFVNSVSSMTVSRATSIMPVLNHNIDMNGANSDSSDIHPEFGSHVALSTTTFNYAVVLFFTTLAIFVFLYLRLLFLSNDFYLTKLNYWRQRYSVIIKPKLETIFHHWLNLLGGSVALSF